MTRGRVLVVGDDRASLDELSAQLSELGWTASEDSPGRDALRELDESMIRSLDEIATEHVVRAVEAAGGNVRKSARLLRVSPSTVYAHLRKWS